ncbi:glycine zipper 2TM domain-containing protein [Thalassobaculum sp.]|uniref:glycine zipper 2TM domain-containing protein n=1 Tax=Thalassobaculum sp. TaxID=2022740 RepID=UPI0032EC7CA5
MHSRSVRHLALAAIAVVSLGATDAVAKGKNDAKYEYKETKHGYEYKYDDGNCKVSKKYKNGKYDEKVKCKNKQRSAPQYIVVERPVWTAEPPRDYRPIDVSGGFCNRELLGQVLGGAAGAAIGSQFGAGTGRLLAVAGGTLAGFFVGGEIGGSLDRADQLCADQALEYAPNGRAVEWRNPDSNVAYHMVPTETFQAGNRYCRTYTTTAIIGGRPQEAYGTACRQPDGSWEVVNN